MEKGCISICKKKKKKKIFKQKSHAKKSNPQSNCPMTCPHGPRPTLPGLCRHGSAALGVFPGAPPPPAPPLGSKGSFLKPPPIAADRPQGCALAPGPQVSPPPPPRPRRHTCMQDLGRPPHGVATLPTAKLLPSHTSWRPSGSGSNCFPSPTLKDVNSSVQPSPSCQRTHLSPILRDLPWVAVLSCPLLASNTQFYVFQL